jgi:HlyD family secretion protein
MAEPSLGNAAPVPGHNRRRNTIIAISLAGILIIGTAYGVYTKVTAPAANAANIRWVPVRRGDVSETISATGTVQSPIQLNLSFPNGNGGRLTSLNVKIGDHVKAGQVLATLDDSVAKTQVANAEANLLSAQARLTQAEEGATPQAIAVQQAAVDRAKAALDGAETAYADQQALFNDRTQDRQQVINAQNQAEQAYNQLQSAKAGLDAAKARLAAAEEGPSAADLNAAEMAVQTAQNQLNIAEQQLNQAETAYQSQQNNPSGQPVTQSEINTDQQAVYQAQQNLANAQKQLADLQALPDPNAVAQAQAAVAQAQAAVDQAQASYNTAEENLALATQNYNDRTQAQAALDQAKNNLAQAQASYNEAVAQLNQLKAPPDPASIQVAQAGVAQAQAQLQQQEVTLSQLTLRAPIDGIVTQVNGQVGELPQNGTPVIVLDDANTRDLQIMAQVSQSDIGLVQAGQSAQFTTSSFANKTFHGTVLMVYPEATTQNGVTTYNVLLSVDNSEELLKPGMTANVTINVGIHHNVLYVPAAAIKELNGIDGVFIANGGSSPAKGTGRPATRSSGNGNVRFQPVTTGFFSADRVEITSGLKEGDLVEITFGSPSSSSPQGQRFAGFGGGFGGMGGFGGIGRSAGGGGASDRGGH